LEQDETVRTGLNGKSIFSAPFGTPEKEVAAYRNKMGWASGTFSDCLAVLQAYQETETASVISKVPCGILGEEIFFFKDFI
jgi:hypothetical protein